MSQKNQNQLTKSTDQNFLHIVYFWLINPNDKEVREIFEKSLSNFINNSKFIETKHLGVPAATDRGVIDSSYTYCLKVTFDSKASHDQYQVEAGHLQFIEECSQLWDRVLVYDSENIL